MGITWINWVCRDMMEPGTAWLSMTSRDIARQGIYLRGTNMQFEKSADTKVLEEVLRKVNVGEVITYTVL